MEKSRDAFRTISEVAGWLDVPTHVLRFWESRFSQIKPVKRAGGRRYYRPSDMALIGGIKKLLHDDGMTIRGVQKMLREQGVKHVSGFSPPVHSDDTDAADDGVIEGVAVSQPTEAPPVSVPAPAARSTRDAEPAPQIEEQETAPEESARPEAETSPEMVTEESTEPSPLFAHRSAPEPETTPEPDTDAAEESVADPLVEVAEAPRIPETPNVPATDPEDDDAEYDGGVGILPRMRAANRGALAAQTAALKPVADRLRSLRDRLQD